MLRRIKYLFYRIPGVYRRRNYLYYLFHKKTVRAFLRRYGASEDPEIRAVVEHVKTYKRINMFNYDYTSKYKWQDHPIAFDAEANLFYTVYRNHRMYLQRGLSSKAACNSYLQGIYAEQDPASPHRYLTESYPLCSRAVVLDAGAAEGFFAIDALAHGNQVVAVECDAEWLEALRLTFREEIAAGNVVLIDKTLGYESSNEGTTIDEVFALYPNLRFIKMDIEGYETLALLGGKKWMKHGPDGSQLCVCTYHTATAREEVQALAEETFSCESSKGYMAMAGTLRRGILRCRRR